MGWLAISLLFLCPNSDISIEQTDADAVQEADAKEAKKKAKKQKREAEVYPSS